MKAEEARQITDESHDNVLIKVQDSIQSAANDGKYHLSYGEVPESVREKLSEDGYNVSDGLGKTIVISWQNNDVVKGSTIKWLDALAALFPDAKSIIIGADSRPALEIDVNAVSAIGDFEKESGTPDVELSFHYKGKGIFFLNSEAVLESLKK